MKYLTEAYKPQRVLQHFEDICRIPHGSTNEKNLGDHIINLAKKHNLDFFQDSIGNILIRKPATCNKNHDTYPLLFQGHMDMVCVKDDGCKLDMENEAIELILDDNILRANGTSLGADNAVGISNMLAIMVADDLIHPTLEFLFTVQEEIGLVGIQKFDMSQIKSTRMITMDCGDPDKMVISSAGTLRFHIKKQCKVEPICGISYKIIINGLIGGHSGIEIGKNRASAVELIGRVLNYLSASITINLVSIRTKDTNSNIPKALECVIIFKQEDVKNANKLIDKIYSNIYKEYSDIETTLKLDFNVVDLIEETMICRKDTQEIIDFLVLIPYDVQNRSMVNLEWILCSSLLSFVNLNDDFLTGKFAIRANIDELKYNVYMQVKRICYLCNIELEQYDEIPAWQNKPNSDFQSLCIKTYKELFNEVLQAEPIHGAVEASFISFAIPNMDIIGIAPKSRGAHTTNEHLYIESMQPFWDFLIRLIENMCSDFIT